MKTKLLIFLLTLFLLQSCVSLLPSTSSIFRADKVKLGMSKETFLAKFGMPYKQNFYYNEANEYCEVLFYRENVLAAGSWIEMDTVFLLQGFNLLIMLVIFLGAFTGICFLQAYLSKRQNKWLGLILPILKIVFSVLFIFLIFMNIYSSLDDPSSISMSYRNVILFAIIFNITTVVYFIIYFYCRKNLKNKNSVDKMRIKDL